MLAVLLVAPLGTTFELSNAHIRLQIESSATDAWFSFVGAPNAPNLLSVVPQLTPLWEAQFATPAGLVQRTNRNATSVVAHATETSLTLEWSCREPLSVAVPYVVRVSSQRRAGVSSWIVRCRGVRVDHRSSGVACRSHRAGA